MKDLALNQNWDLKIEDGDLVQVEAENFAIQNLKQTLQLFRGEYFINKKAGVPYIQNVFDKSTPITIIEEEFKNTILEKDYVESLLEFELTLDKKSRTGNLYFAVRFTSGEEEAISFDL